MCVIHVFGVRRFCGTRVRKFAVPIGVRLSCGTRLRDFAVRRLRKIAASWLRKIDGIILEEFSCSLPSLSRNNKVERSFGRAHMKDAAASKPPLSLFDEFQSLEQPAR